MAFKSPVVSIAKKVCPAVITVIVSKNLPAAENLYSFPHGNKNKTEKICHIQKQNAH